jgi:Rap1a immunity proteins
MRRMLLAFLVLGIVSFSASAAGIQTGRDLVGACTEYVARSTGEDYNAARRPHPCLTFLQGFAASLISRQEAAQNGRIQGLPYASKEPCIRLPDFLSFKDMAKRILQYAQNYPAMLSAPAATLAQKTMERDFPCPPPRPR